MTPSLIAGLDQRITTIVSSCFRAAALSGQINHTLDYEYCVPNEEITEKSLPKESGGSITNSGGKAKSLHMCVSVARLILLGQSALIHNAYGISWLTLVGKQACCGVEPLLLTDTK